MHAAKGFPTPRVGRVFVLSAGFILVRRFLAWFLPRTPVFLFSTTLFFRAKIVLQFLAPVRFFSRVGFSRRRPTGVVVACFFSVFSDCDAVLALARERHASRCALRWRSLSRKCERKHCICLLKRRQLFRCYCCLRGVTGCLCCAALCACPKTPPPCRPTTSTFCSSLFFCSVSSVPPRPCFPSQSLSFAWCGCPFCHPTYSEWTAGGTGGFTRKLGELPKMSRPGSGAGASVVPCGMLVAVSSQYSDVWMEAMRMEFDGLVAAGTFCGSE